MREIEFRAWHKKYKYMARVADISFNRKVVNLNAADICKIEDIELMQYTGLKDKNGVKIFEGDILKYPDNDEKDCIGVVEYGHFNCSCCHAVFGFTTINNKGWEIDMLVNDKEETPLYEVIGNIYENPEFLEVKI